MTTAPPTQTTDRPVRRPLSVDVVRSVATFVTLLVAFAVGLRALDELPGLATGVARGVKRIDSIAALERLTSRRMPIPAYFPDTLTWPPDTLLAFEGTSTSMSFRHRREATTWLIVAIATGRSDVAPQVLPPATSLQTESTMVRNGPATVDRVRDRDGIVWHQLTWREAGTTRLVRYRGTLDDAMLIANSIDERGR